MLIVSDDFLNECSPSFFLFRLLNIPVSIIVSLIYNCFMRAFTSGCFTLAVFTLDVSIVFARSH